MDNLSYKKLLKTKKFPQLENNGEHLKKLKVLQEKMLFIQGNQYLSGHFPIRVVAGK